MQSSEYRVGRAAAHLYDPYAIMTQRLDRFTVHTNLHAYTTGRQIKADFAEWLGTAIVGNRITMPVPETDLIHDLLMSIDLAMTFESSNDVLENIAALLRDAPPIENLRELLPVTVSASRFADVLRMSAAGENLACSASLVHHRREVVQRPQTKIGGAEHGRSSLIGTGAYRQGLSARRGPAV